MAVIDPNASTNPMSSAADRALLDYLDGLLHDTEESASLDLFPADAALAESRESIPRAKVTALPTAPRNRPARVVEALKNFAEPRPFAEPVRTFPLRMPPLPAPVASAVVATQSTPTAEAPPTPVAPAPRAPIKITPQPVIAPIAVEPVPAIAVPVVEEVVAEASVVDALAWAPNGRPQWAQHPFECLLFSAGGLTLAVPLVELGSIYPLERDDLTEIFGQVEWFLGLIRTPYGNVRVVDTARVVMPERYQDSMPADYKFVITLANSDWGLGVDAVAGTALLDPSAVRWRGERSKRPWLAGTVVEKMCALLDAAQLGAMFNRMDRKRGD